MFVQALTINHRYDLSNALTASSLKRLSTNLVTQNVSQQPQLRFLVLLIITISALKAKFNVEKSSIVSAQAKQTRNNKIELTIETFKVTKAVRIPGKSIKGGLKISAANRFLKSANKKISLEIDSFSIYFHLTPFFFKINTNNGLVNNRREF